MSGQQPGNYEGIVVVGAPRSGTTLVRRLLNAHPAIACPPETNLFGACSRFLHEDSFGDGLSVGVVPGLSFSGYDEEQVLGRLRELAFGFLREIAENDGKKFWAEKTAFDSFHIDGIQRVCGDRVRYLCIYRHGLDVICSLRELCDKMESYVDELHSYIRLYPRPLEAFAHAWVDVTRRMRQLVNQGPQLCQEVRYEDLVADPARELSRIFTALDLPTDVDKLLKRAFEAQDRPGLGDWKTYQLGKITGQSIGRWNSIKGESLHQLARIVNPLLRELRYEPVPEVSERTTSDARRRMELSLLAARLKASPRDSDPDTDAK
jgi:hypothetical protein